MPLHHDHERQMPQVGLRYPVELRQHPKSLQVLCVGRDALLLMSIYGLQQV